MIKGAVNWNKTSAYYIQTNNPSEELLRKTQEDQGRSGYLETCGPTAAVNCLAALGYNLNIICPGEYKPQPEEVLSDFLNDKANYEQFKRIRENLDPAYMPNNRVPQYYPWSVLQVFNAKALFFWKKSWLYVTEKLTEGDAIQLCLIRPGHYIAAVAYDLDTNEIIYNDPWPGRHKDGSGFNKRMKRDEYEENVNGYFIIYTGGTK